MQDEDKTKEQLINELQALRERLAESEQDKKAFRHADDALRQENEFLGALLETIPNPVFYKDPEGRYIGCNKAFEKFYGRPRQEIIGKTVYAMGPREIAEQYDQKDKELFSHLGQQHYDWHVRRHDGEIREVSFDKAAILDREGRCRGIVGVISDVTERRQAESALRESKERYATLFDQSPIAIELFDSQGNLLMINRACTEMFGLVDGQETLEFKLFNDPNLDASIKSQLLTGREVRFETKFDFEKVKALGLYETTKSGMRILDVVISPIRSGPHTEAYIAQIQDITQRKRAEEEHETVVEFLQLVNQSKNTEELIHAATGFFRQKSGCEAVGVRLQQEHDYPYYETRGFPEKFVRLENSLCTHDEDGQPILDRMGNPVLACMCGNVICGRVDPSQPFFTAKGSFWTNSTTALLAASSEADRQARTRNRCNGEGYESVALIPLRVGEERLGLLQLNDQRKDLFTAETIALWERLADYAAMALSRLGVEEALRENKSKLEAALASMTDAVFISDLEGRFLDFNDAFATFHRFADKDECSKTLAEYSDFLDVFLPDGKPAPLEMWAVPRALRGERVSNAEYMLRRKDTGETWVGSYSFSPILDKEGKIVGSVVVGRDITEHKLAEQALVASENKYRELVKTANSIILRWDRDGIIRFINEYGLRFFGYSADELLNRHVMTVVPMVETSTGKKPAVIANDILLHPGRHTNVPSENIRKDGSSAWVAWTNNAILNEQGKVQEVLAIGNDITPLKETEAALRTSNERLELLAQVAQQLLRAEDPQLIVEELCRLVMPHIDCQLFFNYLVDASSRRIRLNACAGISDEVAESIRNLDFGEAVCGCVARDRERIMAKDIQNSDDPRTRLVKSLGVQAYCCHPLLVEGELIGTLAFGTRNRVKFTADEVALMKAVTDQVAVAMQRLRTNQSLRESEEKLRRSLSEKEVLLKEIHHRVKNNMQVISSLVSLQAEELQDTPLRAALQDVTHRVRSMALVHEKLYQSADLARVEFADYAQSMLDYLWQAYRNVTPDIRLTTDMESVSLPVNMAVPCGLILNELVGNVLKHAFRNGQRGEVLVSLRGDKQGRVRLTVRDNGCGLPPEFDWQETKSLGLRLVQMLAGQIDATVGVDSNAGTEFTIAFKEPGL